ncbi:MAG: YqeG family HAD IIIA-type phosphatase [Lactobacillus sp.]|nr:YqeG family HAD IIIA-type phosphatase [Lactobacillus sp.]MDN6043047.1 YqeG family HAD IIIA-type phosphatase [Lactobacillus sp.]MDN6051978.1 YqeG family HAD IIIA-type phosphatase [Lactobacillus sp.]
MLFQPQFKIDMIYHLDAGQLRQMGIKAVFSDLDNTLLAWNDFETAAKMAELHERLAAADIQLIVISNNNFQRVGKVLDPYHIDFVAKAKKPLPLALSKERRRLRLSKSQVLMVGDQLITDIQAGNLAGVGSVLVRPLVTTDKWNTRINRFFEKIIFMIMGCRHGVAFKKELETWKKH